MMTGKSHFTSAEIRAAVTDLRYRFDVLANNYVNSNTLPGGGINKTAMYSSIENKLYADFLLQRHGQSDQLAEPGGADAKSKQLFQLFYGNSLSFD